MPVPEPTSVTQSIVSETPEVEAYKLTLLKNASNLAYNVDAEGKPVTPLAQLLPQYKIAGFSDYQLDALRAAGNTGIGSFAPYLNKAQDNLTLATGTTQEAADILRKSDTRDQFGAAREAMQRAGLTAGNISSGMGYITGGIDALGRANALATDSASANLDPANAAIGGGIGALINAQNLALNSANPDYSSAQQGLTAAQQQAARYSQADIAPAMDLYGQGATGLSLAQQMAQRSDSPNYGQAQAGLGQAAGTMRGAVGTIASGQGQYDPNSALAYMNPYTQQVLQAQLGEMNRQAQIQQLANTTQAIRAGAFGGDRAAVQQAETQRSNTQLQNQAIANSYNQNYAQAQQAAMSAYEQGQQRNLAAGLGTAQAGQALAGVAGQQAGITGQQTAALQQAAQIQAGASGQQGQLAQGIGSLASNQAQLGQSGAQIQAQIASQRAGITGQQTVAQQQAAQIAAAAAAQQGQLGQGLGSLAISNEQLGQGAAGIMTNQAAAAGNLAGQQGSIYAQQAQAQQALGQGIGSLAAQQYGIGQNMATTLGGLGGQLGTLGVQQAALGQTAQQMNTNDINLLYNSGQAKQALAQQTEDAARANKLQEVYAPYQQAGFLSDIYRGHSSGAMSTTAASAAGASPFMQAVGITLPTALTVAGVKKIP